MRKLYITEKHDVAQNIARVLKATERKNGYYFNSNTMVAVSWSIGHLVGLPDAHIYDEKYSKWTKEDLPIIPDQFKLSVHSDPGRRKQFKILKELIGKAESIVCATDIDREGELIFHYIYQLAGTKKSYTRILPSDLTDSGITKTLSKEIPPRINIIKSAECRNQSDWLLGINTTRAISLASNSNSAINMGRVTTPTLSLVCERFLQNKNFKPEPYFPILIDLEKNGSIFQAKISEPPKTKQNAESIISQLNDQSLCTKAEKKEVKENPPLLYILSSLQIDANKQYDLDPQQTLDIAQDLYEKHKITTYPRTDSGYITTDLFAEIPDRLRRVINQINPALSDQFDFDRLPARCVNDKKAPNHHGIIPTGDLSSYDKLNDNEKAVFNLLTKRFIAAFAQPCIKLKTKYEFENNDYQFITTGSVTQIPGWRSIIGHSTNKEEADKNIDLPDVSENEDLPTSNPVYQEKMTQPPKLLTKASLLELMLSCGNKMENKMLKEAMKDTELRQGGLATEATRGATIKKLFTKGFIITQKRNIVPTDLGISLYNKINHLDISKPELTAQWEVMLEKIANGEYDQTQFMNQIYDYTREITKDLLSIGKNIDIDPLKLSCPKCKKGKILIGSKGYGCSRWNENPKCDFVIWKNRSGKTLSVNQVKSLVETGKTGVIKGFKYKDKEGSFDAPLKLAPETFKIEFDFDSSATTKSGDKLKCPKCKSDIRLNTGGAFCSSESDCVKLFRKKSEKSLTDSQLISLLTKGKTSVIKGFKKYKSQETFDAALILKDDFTIGFAPKK